MRGSSLLLSVLALSVSLATSSTVFAKTKVDIYEASVPIAADAGQDEQNQALEQGFIEVLQKATGQQDLPKSSAIESAKKDIESVLQRYRVEGEGEDAVMQASFLPERIDSIIQSSNLSLWPAERKSILVWLVDENESDPDAQIAWEQSGLEVLTQLTDAAQKVGVPVFFPVGDIEDVTNISSSDVEGNFTSRLASASSRYPADAILAVVKKSTDSGQEVQWRFYDQSPESLSRKAGTPEQGSLTEQDADVAFEKMMRQLSSHFVANSADKKKDAPVVDEFVANFNGISKARDLIDMQNRLKSFASVGNVQISGIKGRSASLNIQLIAPKSQFDQEIIQSRYFMPSSEPVAADSTATSGGEDQVLGADLANNEAQVMQAQQAASTPSVDTNWYQYQP